MSLTDVINQIDEGAVLASLMVEQEIITSDEYKLVAQAFGDTQENWEKVLYSRTGLNSLEQLIEDLGITEPEVLLALAEN